MSWYVFFVRTGREEQVKQLINEWLDSEVYKPFIPLQERLFKVAGIVKKEWAPLFPSYVFIESNLPDLQFVTSTNSMICTSSDIIRLLRYSKFEASMRDSEKQMLESLCNDSYCIESSTGIIEGDNIRILDGPLKGRGSIVKKIDRHKRQAVIQLEFMGDIRLVRVALEIISKV
ncbi:antitermination protein NusG [Paenibacillus polymyxa]|uniref:Antiterminator LoaP n=1 Tax=Paenibacillus polymyxa TaxID=1406 RepID=A0A1D7MDU8_PAEPO|nr:MULTISPECIES: antiterminator LoaP [Paenibacillus]MBP1177206.1 transcriptional antiterminator NusG [Paenibacillus sp. PvR133]MCP3793329.1 antiterminator LoaP [Paenibacillus sp. CH40]AOK88949.1 antitermination protein NusG [Paenibacillus polymyxa]APB70556.1 antitermination protein NusG [Paenibacillus polymyxa]KAF6578103.1 antiterminator LoaP [Paenibacillus sp. EKM212P]